MSDKRNNLAAQIERFRESERAFYEAIGNMRNDLAAAADENAKCRIVMGLDVPTLIQWNHGEFDDA
jgi:hypothetical protein